MLQRYGASAADARAGRRTDVSPLPTGVGLPTAEDEGSGARAALWTVGMLPLFPRGWCR
jgi:hypothetical protein